MNESNVISSKSTDFQPTTQNPQDNVAGGLQPNSANLQPISGINQQTLPNTTTLRVLNSQAGTLVAATPTDQSTPNSGMGIIWIFVVVVIALIGGLLLLAKAAKPTSQTSEKTTDSTPDSTAPLTRKSKKKKQKTKRSRRRN